MPSALSDAERSIMDEIVLSNLRPLLILGLLLGIQLSPAEIVEDASFAGPKTTVRYAMWGGKGEMEQVRGYAQAFVKENPSIRVDMGVYPWGQYWAKLQTQMASGLAPDVMQFYSGSFGVWVARGALMPLDDLARQANASFDGFFPVTLENCRWDGKLYAIPTDIAEWSLVYNADLLEQNGIPRSDWPKSDTPMTWGSLQALGRRLTLRNADGSYAQYGMGAGQNWDQAILGMNGGAFVDRPVNPTRSAVKGNEPLAKALIALYQSQYGDRWTLGAKPLASGAFTANSDTLLINPKFAMVTTGPWALKELRDAGVHIGTTPMPLGDKPHALINVNSVGMYAHSKHPTEAFKLMQFLTSAKIAEDRGRQLQGIPPRKDAVDAFIHNADHIPGCEAFVQDLSVAAPTLTTNSTDVGKAIDSWLSATEADLDSEYDKRLNALPKGDPRAYRSFVTGMNEFVEKSVRSRLPQLDKDLNLAILKVNVAEPGPGVRVLQPLLAFVLLTLVGFAYVRAIGKATVPQENGKRPSPTAYYFLSPWLTGLFCFVIGPILASLILSCTDWNMVSSPHWVGFQNYAGLPGDAKFLIGLKNTFEYALLAIPISLCGGLFTAGLLTSHIRGANLFKAIIYFPALFTGAETAVLWTNMLNKEHGVLNYILSWFHIGGVDWMDAGHAFYSVLLMNVFWIGGAMLVYYAGMKQIPQSLYEAAELDGASLAKRFLKITIPMLSPVILFMVVMTTIGSFQVFTPALFFAKNSTDVGSPGDSLRFYSVNIYDKAFNNLQMGQACAYAIVLFLIIFAITYGQFRLSRRFVYSEVDG